MDTIVELWRQFRGVPFPSVDSELLADLAATDTFAAGCISTFIEQGGSLDAERMTCLCACAEELAAAIPALRGEARAYFGRLLDLSRRVERAARQRP